MFINTDHKTPVIMPGDRGTSLTERSTFGMTYVLSLLIENCFLDLGAHDINVNNLYFYREEKT